MSVGCASILPVNAHLPLMYPKDRQFYPSGFEFVGGHRSVGSYEGYKVQSEQSLTKSTRKRNKRRRSKLNDAVPLMNTQSGTLVGVVGEKTPNPSSVKTASLDRISEEEKAEDVVDASTSSYSITPNMPLIKATSSSSYAAVVSGRNNRDLLNMDDFRVCLEVDQVSPPNGHSGMLMFERSQALSSQASTRDVGVQVNLGANGQRGPQSITRNQSTMTSKKGKYKNKFVSVRMCCLGLENTNAPPPVEFLGEHFTFENAVAKTVANFGITFGALRDDEIPMFSK